MAETEYHENVNVGPSYSEDTLIGVGGLSEIHQRFVGVAEKLTPITLEPISNVADGEVELSLFDDGLIVNGQVYHFTSWREKAILRNCLREYHTLREAEGIEMIPKPLDLYFASFGGRVYAVMEMSCLPGDEVEDMDLGDLSLPDIGKILSDSATVLEELDRRNIVHGDVKTGNVLYRISGLLGEGMTGVIDFGFARMRAGLSFSVDMPEIDREIIEVPLRDDELVGTTVFYAPEQSVGCSGVCPRADWFALGLVAYRLLVNETVPLSPAYKLLEERLIGTNRFTSFHLSQLRKYDNFQRDMLVARMWQKGTPVSLAEAVGECLDARPGNRNLKTLIEEGRNLAHLRIPVGSFLGLNERSSISLH